MTNEEIIDIVGGIEYVPGDVPRADEVNAIIAAVVEAWQKLFQVAGESSQGVGFASDSMNFFAHKDMNAYSVFTIDKDVALPDDPNIETERPYFVSRDITEDEASSVPLFFIMADIPSGPGICYSLSFAGARILRVDSPVELGAQATISGTSVVPAEDGPLVCVAKDTIVDGVQHFVRLAKGGSSEAYEIMAVVTEPIQRTTDPSGEPSGYSFGKARILVRDETISDCACLFLAHDGSGGSNDEQIVKGKTVVVDGPFMRDNPNFDDQQPESETNPRQIEYYLVKKYEGNYFMVLDSDCQSGGWTTFKIKDTDGVTVLATIAASGNMIRPGYYIPGNSNGYEIERKETNEGYELVIIGGPCPQSQTL